MVWDEPILAIIIALVVVIILVSVGFLGKDLFAQKQNELELIFQKGELGMTGGTLKEVGCRVPGSTRPKVYFQFENINFRNTLNDKKEFIIAIDLYNRVTIGCKDYPRDINDITAQCTFKYPEDENVEPVFIIRDVDPALIENGKALLHFTFWKNSNCVKNNIDYPSRSTTVTWPTFYKLADACPGDYLSASDMKVYIYPVSCSSYTCTTFDDKELQCKMFECEWQPRPLGGSCVPACSSFNEQTCKSEGNKARCYYSTACKSCNSFDCTKLERNDCENSLCNSNGCRCGIRCQWDNWPTLPNGGSCTCFSISRCSELEERNCQNNKCGLNCYWESNACREIVCSDFSHDPNKCRDFRNCYLGFGAPQCRPCEQLTICSNFADPTECTRECNKNCEWNNNRCVDK